jgi:hypothetical protein
VSAKFTLVRALGAVIVKVRLVLAPNNIGDVPNAFVMVGGPIGKTVKTAVAAFPAPATVSVAVNVFASAPGAVPVTLTWTVQAPPARIVDVPTEMVFEPATAVIVPSEEPGVQADSKPLGVDIT